MSETIRTIVVDDEPAARDILCNLLKRYAPEIEVVARCEDVTQAVEAIKAQAPQLVFLDVEMPNTPGYELVNFFPQINFEIIFVTAYDQYALKAFELSAVDYLLKPIDISRLKEAILKLKEKVKLNNLRENYHALKDSLESNSMETLAVPYQDGQRILQLDEVIVIEAQEAYSCVHTVDGEKYIVSRNLKQFEKLLEDHAQFFRTHKSWMINFKHIEKILKSKLEIHMLNGIVARLSRYKKSEFLEKVV